jgi:hypothetical protein
MNIIAKAKEILRAQLDRGDTVTCAYRDGDTFTITARDTLSEAISKLDEGTQAYLVRMLVSGDHAEAGKVLACEVVRSINDSVKENVGDWLAHEVEQDRAT